MGDSFCLENQKRFARILAKTEKMYYDKQTTSFFKEEWVMAQVTRDTNIGDLLRIDMGVAPILMGIGMHCLGCPASQGESIAEAAMVHGIDPDALVDEINKFLAEKH